jgi:uncharacterized YigZ family protein
MDSPSFEVPAGAARADFKVSNSRFIASLDCVESMDEARAFLARIRAEFPDATHNVPAFVVGGARSRTEFCSDDGEPGGTAGRPLLAVLKGSGLGNVAVVVTRYFGGTLLGTGGLVKAYSEAGREVIARAGRARLETLELIEIVLPYRVFEPFKRMADEAGAELLFTDFAESVRARLELPAEMLDAFLSKLADLTGGGSAPLRLGSRRGLGTRRGLGQTGAPGRQVPGR